MLLNPPPIAIGIHRSNEGFPKDSPLRSANLRSTSRERCHRPWTSKKIHVAPSRRGPGRLGGIHLADVVGRVSFWQKWKWIKSLRKVVVFKKRCWEELGNCPKNPDPHNNTPNFGPNKTDGNTWQPFTNIFDGILGVGKIWGIRLHRDPKRISQRTWTFCWLLQIPSILLGKRMFVCDSTNKSLVQDI